MKIDLNQKVKEALGRTEFMALSTVGGDGPWVCPVQYACGPKLELYFISMMHAKHVQNILENPRVSAAIFKTERFADGEVLGLQLKGTAKHLTDTAEVAEATKHYGEKLNGEWHYFKITPTELWLFDSREFGEERQQVDLSTPRLS